MMKFKIEGVGVAAPILEGKSVNPAIQLTGTGTCTFEGSMDDVNWSPIVCIKASTGEKIVELAGGDIYYPVVTGASMSFRINVSAYTNLEANLTDTSLTFNGGQYGYK